MLLLIEVSAARKHEQKLAKFLKTQKTCIKAISKSQKTYIEGLPKFRNI